MKRILCVIALLLGSATAQAQVPYRFNYAQWQIYQAQQQQLFLIQQQQLQYQYMIAKQQQWYQYQLWMQIRNFYGF